MILDGAKEHYILDIEHNDKAIEIIETLLPAMPYPKRKRSETDEGVSKHKIIKEKDSLYVFILAYNESLFF